MIDFGKIFIDYRTVDMKRNKTNFPFWQKNIASLHLLILQLPLPLRIQMDKGLLSPLKKDYESTSLSLVD